MTEEQDSVATLLAKKEYSRALPLLKREHEKYPSNPRIRLQYADALAGVGMSSEAIEQYEETSAYYAENGLTVQAIAVQKKAEKLRDQQTALPGVKEPRIPIKRDKVIATAEKLVAKGKIEDAIKEYQKLLIDNPVDINTLNRIGDLWVRINRNEEAVSAFAAIADHYSDDGFFLKAIAIYKKINKLDPSKLDIYAKLANLYAQQGLAMEAKSQYQVLADYYLKHSDPANALAIYRKISDLDPNSINVHVKLADLYSRNDQTAEALKEYDRVGRMLLKRGMRDEAVEIYTKAMKIDPHNIDIVVSLATTLLEGKEYRRSEDVVREALSSIPGDSRLTAMLGRIYLVSGNALAALRLLEPLLEQRPGELLLRDVLADVYLGQKDVDRALEVLRPLVSDAMARGDGGAALEILQRIRDIDSKHDATAVEFAAVEKEWKRRQAVALLRPFIGDQAKQLGSSPSSGSYIVQSLESLNDNKSLAASDGLTQILEWIASPDSGTTVIFGAPGGGKTALLDEMTRRLSRSEEGPVPILIRLRDIKKLRTLDDIINQFLRSAGIDDVDAFAHLLRESQVVLLMDGLDEATLTASQREEVFNAIIRASGATMSKIVLTTRDIQAELHPFSGVRYCRLLPLSSAQIGAFLLSRLRSAELVARWLDLIQRNDSLQSLCESPAMLGLVSSINIDRLMTESKASDSISAAAVYKHLIDALLRRDANRSGASPEASLDALAAVAVWLWRMDKSSLTGVEISAALSRRLLEAQWSDVKASPFLVREQTDRFCFNHRSFMDWLVASQAAEDLRAHREPMALSEAAMSPAITEFFCDLAGHDATRQWATSALRRAEASVLAKENAQLTLLHLGTRSVRTEAQISDTSTIDPKSVEADAHERSGRSLLAGHGYSEAMLELTAALTVDPLRAPRMNAEFGFLLRTNFPTSPDDGLSADRLRWCTDLWRAMTQDIAFGVRHVNREEAHLPLEESVPVEAYPSNERSSPQVVGEELEEAVLRLFRQFFILADSDEGDFRVQLQKLRKQKAGSQFGYDLAFEAAVAGYKNVRCHVECKNYSSTISLKDVADKLLQQKSHGVQIDHWILISPHADPSQDLHHFLEYESKALDFPFDIHVWSPETGVDQFFGLEPRAHEKFYGRRADQNQVEAWTAEKKAAVVERYRYHLRPVYRLPRGWHEYVETEKHLCFSDAEADDFERTHQTFIPIAVRDQSGVDLPGTAKDCLLAWLDDPTRRVAFVLGEFGDGKSFLTYLLSRELLNAFRAAPVEGFIPLRLALREFGAAGSVREFLQARMEVFGADLAGWAAVKRNHKTLVILDGFDEISKELDPGTITKNIRSLIDCCTAPVFDGCKILITSRTHFFETGDASRLLQRLDGPLLLQLTRIPRGQVLSHLQDAAKGPEEEQLLQRLSRMHDPIGLGTKPLFLQMLKDTLHELPVDLDEVTVYESYARRCLDRKIELLDDPEYRAGRNESVQQLLSALGIIAEELQCSTDAYVSLKKLRLKTGPFAELLWRLTGGDQLESDAEARLGTRSLLARVAGLAGEGQWLVDFCHRSIREYFVARRFADCIMQGSTAASEFLCRVPVNHEILYFSACLLRRSRDERAITVLRELICRSKVDEDVHSLAGRALTVLLRVSTPLPRDIDFTYRNFDSVDLEDSDISGLDFTGSSFKGANFANANLETANLSGCDLTGVRLHETTSVQAVVAPSADRIFAAYEDGTIWEWDAANDAKPTSRIVFTQPGLKPSRLGVTRSGVPWGIAGREALLFEMMRSEWTCIAKIPLSQASADVFADDRFVATLLADKTVHCLVFDLQRREASLDIPMPESSVFVAVTADLVCFRESESAIRMRGRDTDGGMVDCQIPTGNATSLHALVQSPREVLVAVGETDGVVRVVGIKATSGDCAVTNVFKARIHSGPVLSVMFADSKTVVSGGVDRTIALTPIRASVGASRKLQLNLRCSGLKTDGLKPEAQRSRLNELISKAVAYT